MTGMSKLKAIALCGCTLLLLPGCAKPTSSADGPDQPSVSMPTSGLASCVNPKATAPATAQPRTAPPKTAPTLTASASGSASGPDESGAPTPPPDPEREWAKKHAENKAFRERSALPPLYVAAAQPCVERIRAGLATLRNQQRFEIADVTRVLEDVGLPNPMVRRPGRFDQGYLDGVVFGTSTGVGCLFGEHGPKVSSVEVGGMIADGGCMVAAD